MTDAGISSRAAPARDRAAPRRSILLTSSHASEGGVSVYLEMLAQAMRRHGWEAGTAALYRSARPDTRRFDAVLLPGARLGVRGYLAGALAYLRHVRRHRPDVVVGAMPLSNVLAGLSAVLTGARAVATHHSPLETQSRTVAALDRVLGSWGAYASIICVSHAVADSFAGHPAGYRRRLRVVPNGVVPVPRAPEPAAVRARHGLDPDLPVVLTAGRLAPQKNPVAAVEAVAQVEGVQLVMAGDGELRGAVEARIRALGIGDRVHLTGQLDRAALHALMGSCDLFMQISLYEGQSLSLLEAVSAGRPILISDVPTQVESVRTGSGAFGATICDASDPGEIAAAIRRALFDDAHRAAVAAAAAELAGSVRTEAEMQAEYAALFDALAARRG